MKNAVLAGRCHVDIVEKSGKLYCMGIRFEPDETDTMPLIDIPVGEYIPELPDSSIRMPYKVAMTYVRTHGCRAKSDILRDALYVYYAPEVCQLRLHRDFGVLEGIYHPNPLEVESDKWYLVPNDVLPEGSEPLTPVGIADNKQAPQTP